MEIELSNGQLKFWQWDTKQKVKVPENVPTVHYKFGSSAVELPATDRWVNVPDELLQTGKDILLWTYDEDHTLDAARIPVEKRPKPADYIYTPTEIKTWDSLDKRIKALEDGGGISGVSSVNGQTGAVTITAEGLGALTEGNLQSATNAALAQAKASGEFDGAPGAPGTPGNDGLSINWRGEYVESTAYAKNDAVSYGGSAYIMVSNSVIGAVPGIDDDWQLMVQKGDAGAQGPAGAGLDVTGATVGQTVKISAVDSNGVPTEWEPVDMASGGGEKSWEKIIDVSVTEATQMFEQDGLDNYTEFFLKWSGLQNATTINSGQNLYINNVVVANAAIIVQKSGADIYGWTWLKYNGRVWIITKSAGAILASNTTFGAVYAPYNTVDGVGMATSLTLRTADTKYAPVSGKLEVWGR